MSFYAGIDVGSATTKAVIIDQNTNVRGRGLVFSGADFQEASMAAFEMAVKDAGLEIAQVSIAVSTGYGRGNVDFADHKRTEIDCHARGAFHYFPRAITVIDIGGQDNKVIILDQKGLRKNFAMNRKCAAGTGSFLEEIALKLRLPLEELSLLAEKSTDYKITIGSYCTVFAMTEILAKIRAGVKIEDLARAALVSVAKRVLETMAISGEVVATGGVIAHNPILQKILSDILKTDVLLPPHPQYIGALGAAIFAAQNQEAV
jgi:predicted CoA-substrate-specific enzyme activase